MFTNRITNAVTALAAPLLLALACEEPSSSVPEPGPITVQIVSGDGQVGPAHQELASALVVQVVDDRDKAKRKPVAGQLVNFVVVSGGGRVFAGAGVTNADGMAREYWTLGEPGPQRLEVRAVDPTTGEKLVFGTFLATGFAAGPEICDGFDNDSNGSVDEGLPYCINGDPAPHTDGSVCDSGFLDLDADPENGCESLDVSGTWGLDPLLQGACDVSVSPSVLPDLTASASVATVTTGVPADGMLAFVLETRTGLSIVPGFLDLLLPFQVTYDPVTGAFAGSGSGSSALEQSTSFGPLTGTITVSGSVVGSFAGPDAFAATLTVGASGSYEVDAGLPAKIAIAVTCSPVTLTTTGSRLP